MQFLTFLTGRKYAACLALLCCTSFLSAQMLDIQGAVTGENGEPLVGVTIRVVNSTDRGTSTDAFGAYSIKATPGERLTFAYTGHDDLTTTVSADGSRVDVKLNPNAILNEVIVVGYGTQKKSDLTGAISSVSGDELRNSMVTNFDQALQGRVAGVQVTQNSGQPGGAASIRIRGANSITGQG